MAAGNFQFLKWNHGLVSRYALARIDLEHLRYAAEVMTNWMPRVFGTMMLRPGMEYITTTLNNLQVKTIPFVRSTSDTATIECCDSSFRVLIDEAPIVRPAVTTTITNPGFTTDITGWTDASDPGGIAEWQGIGTGALRLKGTGFNAGIAYQTVTVAGANRNVEHAVRIVVIRMKVAVRIGSTVGGDEYVSETVLGVGTHSLAFTPSGNFTVQLSNHYLYGAYVDSCDIEAAGTMSLPTPWTVDDFDNLRWDQSADVMYICDGTDQQRKIERRASRSWSIVLYAPEDGPFRTINVSRITLTPSTFSTAGTLTANAPFFKDGHEGCLFRLISAGQKILETVAGDNQFTDSIEVTGVGDSRKFSLDISGTWASTLHLQRSLGGEGAWVNVQTFPNGSAIFDDKLDNQIAYYRLGFATGDYSSGSAVCTLTFGGGSTTGICRVNGIISQTVANMNVIKPFGSLDATNLWYEGAWSGVHGFPSHPVLFEGRLWMLGGDKYFGSVSDAYESFDDDPLLGDAASISRSIGQGPVDAINWAVGLQRLVAGTDGTEISARSSSFDEPLTPTNFNLKFPTNLGSARIPAKRIDDTAVFVQRSTLRIYHLAMDSTNYVKMDYAAADLTALVPELGLPGIAQIELQRQPDTRLHVRRTDGTVFMLVFDALEQVKCWIELELSGLCEDILVLPNSPEDSVYYIVNRTINGSTVRYYEKWANEADCVGGTVNKQADSFVTYSGVATNVLSVPHLKAEEVIVWADGKDYSPGAGGDQKTYTVNSSGTITLDPGFTVSNAVIGLPYKAKFKGVKLAYAAQMGSALTQRKRVSAISVILADAHYQGLQYGPTFSILDDLPLVEEGAVTDADTVWTNYDKDSFSFNGTWTEDSRICLQATAPRPVKVMALVVSLDTKG